MDIDERFLTRLLRDKGGLDLAVSDELHPRDGMLAGDMAHYLRCGRDALFNIALGQASAGAAEPSRILDFACGFGRVARQLRAAFPSAEITFTDAMPDASAFCAKAFSGRDKPIRKDFEGYNPGGSFDLIWIGSLFTHLPSVKSAELINLLFGLVSPGGVIVFTSHGRHVRDRRSKGKWPYAINASQYDAMIQEASATGYGFVGYEGNSEYGISLASLGWWECALGAINSSEIVLVRERGWDRHQDVIAIKRLV